LAAQKVSHKLRDQSSEPGTDLLRGGVLVFKKQVQVGHCRDEVSDQPPENESQNQPKDEPAQAALLWLLVWRLIGLLVLRLLILLLIWLLILRGLLLRRFLGNRLLSRGKLLARLHARVVQRFSAVKAGCPTGLGWAATGWADDHGFPLKTNYD
jgi:hypothetical protein